MNGSLESCQICIAAPYKYTCPRCNKNYCSLSCYKSQEHLKCSEEFYKQCIQEELNSTAKSCVNNKDDMRKIYDILKRIRAADAGLEIDNFTLDGLDSDDDQNEININGEESESISDVEDDYEDLAQRLKDIDINNADEVWQILTTDEKEDFKKLVTSGDIMKLVTDFKPWWLNGKSSKIIVLTSDHEEPKPNVPEVVDNIPKFSTICSKTPAPCVHYNLWNILAAYSCTVRYFNGEHLTNPSEATAYFINICSTLKYGTNFEDVEDAIISVEMEVLTTGNGTKVIQATGTKNDLWVEDRTQLKNDSRQLMLTVGSKLSALSDILRLLKMTTTILKKPNKSEAHFQKLFALSSGMEELTYLKVKTIEKKLVFYLSYVNRQID